MTATEPALLLAPRAEAAIEHIGSPRVTGTQLRAFLALARAGSYAGAAQDTGLSARRCTAPWPIWAWRWGSG
jgi:hypothetical protein